MSNLSETPNEPILYELLEYFVRKQEPELIVSPRPLETCIQEIIGYKVLCFTPYFRSVRLMQLFSQLLAQ